MSTTSYFLFQLLYSFLNELATSFQFVSVGAVGDVDTTRVLKLNPDEVARCVMPSVYELGKPKAKCLIIAPLRKQNGLFHKNFIKSKCKNCRFVSEKDRRLSLGAVYAKYINRKFVLE